MSATVLTADVAHSNWIINKREDLIWFIGSALVGYLALAAALAGMPVLTSIVLWTLIVDGPHLFGTVTRTYFDKTGRKQLGWRLWTLFPFLALGPALCFLGLGTLFVVIFLTWTQYHIAKQHFGFVMLYKKKNGERNDVQLDRKFIVTSCMLPWALILYVSYFKLPYPGIVTVIGVLSYGAFLLFYLKRQGQKKSEGLDLNTPKLMLFSILIPLHWLAFAYAASRPSGVFLAGVAVNVGHSLQYHRLVWFHNRNRYFKNPEAKGLSKTLSRSVLYYGATCFGLYLLFFQIPTIMAGSNKVLLAMLGGINMTHFFLDSKIWRAREDKELAVALNL